MMSSIGFVAYVLVLGLLAIGAWLRPPIAIAALACLFGLKQLGEASYVWLAVNAVVTNFAVAAIVALAVVRRLLQGKMRGNRMPAVYWLILAFYAYALLSVAWTPALAQALNIWGHDYPYMVLFIFVAPWLAATTAELRTAFGWLTYVGGFLVVALLFTARWGDRGLLVSSGSVLDESNPLAIADIAGVVAVSALFIVSARLRALAWAVRLSIAAICAIAIVRSGSRGQLVAICGTFLLMLPVAYPVTRLRRLAGALVAVVVVGGAIAWAVTSYVHWYDDRWLKSTELGDVAGRWTMVSALLKAWSQDGMSVVFGIGNSGSFSPSIAGFYPHNVPLEILGEEGVVGFALYLVLVARVVVAAFRGVRYAAGDFAQRGLLAVTLGCFLFTLIVSLKQGNAVDSVTFFMFSVLACRAAPQVPAAHVQAAAPTTAELRPAELQPAFLNLMR
jgi:hypothetical protein